MDGVEKLMCHFVSMHDTLELEMRDQVEIQLTKIYEIAVQSTGMYCPQRVAARCY